MTSLWTAGIRRVADRTALVHEAVELIEKVVVDAIQRRGRCSIALGGGGTPRPVYVALAERHAGGRSPIDWARVFVLFGDERCVPPEDDLSNFRMANESLLSRVPIPAEQVLRMRGEMDPHLAATEYEIAIGRLLRTTERPVVDLVILGLGEDGHTASLFPGTAAVRERGRVCVPQYVDKLSAWRLTLTPGVIGSARTAVFLVEGASKATSLARVLEGPFMPDVLPAQLFVSTDPVHKSGESTEPRVVWIVDQAAAGGLRRPAP